MQGKSYHKRNLNSKLSKDRPWIVIIFSHNNPEHLAILLRSLEQEADSGKNIDVRVYDNASNDDFREPIKVLQRRG